eukprot:2230497-Amphidinium_carterae.2
MGPCNSFLAIVSQELGDLLDADLALHWCSLRNDFVGPPLTQSLDLLRGCGCDAKMTVAKV